MSLPEQVDETATQRKARLAAIFYLDLVKEGVPSHVAEQLTVAYITVGIPNG